MDRESLREEYWNYRHLKGVRHLVQLHGALDFGDEVQLFLEKGGLSLENWFSKKHSFTFSEILTILTHLLEFHVDMVKKNHIHGDLSVANVLWDLTETKIIDLGASVNLSKPCLTPLTTITYRPPEAIFNTRFDTSYDLWSIGCIAYSLITGYFFQPVRDNDKKTEAAIEIIRLIGAPPPSYLSAENYKSALRIPVLLGYIENHLAQGLQSKEPSRTLSPRLISLIRSMLQYECRIAPEEALRQCQFIRAKWIERTSGCSKEEKGK